MRNLRSKDPPFIGSPLLPPGTLSFPRGPCPSPRDPILPPGTLSFPRGPCPCPRDPILPPGTLSFPRGPHLSPGPGEAEGGLLHWRYWGGDGCQRRCQKGSGADGNGTWRAQTSGEAEEVHHDQACVGKPLCWCPVSVSAHGSFSW